MKTQILYGLLFYYAILSMVFIFSGGMSLGNSNIIIHGNDTITGADPSLSGMFDVIGKFFLWIGFGVGLPIGTPAWFVIMFAIWQSIITIVTVVFLVSWFGDFFG